ncbi:uncharacterized protein [Miscanthus floridulus]|uniref:uncharacterized protein n=1 Tax=Miscanthus floridulus TaxID=154761 RepID=UPI0034582B90
MNQTFIGSSGKGHTKLVAPSPLEGPADDRTTSSSYDDAGSSTLSPASLSKETSTISISWPSGGPSASHLSTSPPDTSSSDYEGEPSSPPPSEAGSLISLPSSTIAGVGGVTRVTYYMASIITIRITANTIATTAAILATDPGRVTPGREGRTTATLLSPPLITT